MSTETRPTNAIEELETVFIPLADGRRLAARLFLPVGAKAEPVPVILEYIPYRRRDGTRLGDESMHRWFAQHGYACARVDIAGSGDSDGVIEDEYAPREQADGVEVIAWLAAQPWSTGAVGMIGISWGGFNGLQIAAERPPALAAVISLCSVVDRYHGDVHFTGGCLNEENLEWGGYFFTMNGLPPDPEIVGHDRWRELWRLRMDNANLHPADWLEHQRRDAFWQHGSINENYARVEVPVLSVSGWADGYTPAVPAIVENLGPHARGILGPWGHKYPHDGVPGPAIGFLQEALRWWDRWLKGVDTGVEADPAMRVWLQDVQVPASHVPQRSGRWIAVDPWPTAEPMTTMYLGDGVLARQPAVATPSSASIKSPLTTGIAAGQWCAYGLGKIAPELSLDQRADDAGSLLYDTVELDESTDIVGTPMVRLRLVSDQSIAQIAVRLNAVHPNGAVERLTYGVMNLCHRTSHEFPSAITPGEAFDVAFALRPLGHRIPAGYRLRLSLSTGYWPMIWPSPRPVTLTVDESASSVDLPVVTNVHELSDDVFEAPAKAKTSRVTVKQQGHETRHIVRDLGARRTEFVASRDDGVYVLDDIGTEQSFTRVRSSSIVDDDPLSARAHVACTATYSRGDWQARIESDLEMTCDAESFYINARLTTYDGDAVFVDRRYSRTIPRDHL